MNTILIIAAFATLASAFPVDEAQVFFTEDTNGNYHLKYFSKSAAREEERFVDGKVLGSYSYVDDKGVSHKITYVAAGENGFNAAGADVPLPVPETPELINARNDHFRLVAEDKALNPIEVPEKPVRVEDVLAQLTVPEIKSLPASAVPPVGSDHYASNQALISEYADALKRLGAEYTRVRSF